jgi:hypothetical protein
MDGKRVKAKRERRRLKQEAPLRERLLKMAADARHEASRLPFGSERNRLLRKAKQAEIGASLTNGYCYPASNHLKVLSRRCPILPLLNARNELERITKWPQFGAPLSIDSPNRSDESSLSATRSAAF